MAPEPYPCPKCGEHRLIYDGVLVWRSGKPRPARKTATKRGKPPRTWEKKQPRVSKRLRSGYEHNSLYHCASCGAEFSHDIAQSRIHLYEEGVPGIYVFDDASASWQFQSFAQAMRAVRKLSPSGRRDLSRERPPGATLTEKRRQRPRTSPRRSRDRGQRGQIALVVVGFVVLVAGLTAVWSKLLLSDGLRCGAILGVGIGFLQAVLNGPRPKSKRDNPSVGAIFGRIVLWALGVVPAGAALGALVGGFHFELDSAATAVRVTGHGLSGAVLGGLAALLIVQVGSAAAAALSTLRGRWKRRVLVEMADAAKGIWYEGGMLVVVPGLVIGAVTGITVALMGV